MPTGIYKRSEETKKKMSEALKGNQRTLGYKHTQEEKRRRSLRMKGKHLSEETKQKIREANIGNKNGLGYKHTKEAKKKLSEAFRGSKGNNWRGGLSFEFYSIDWTGTLRRSIRERDHYICQICGELQSDKAFDVHHIDYNKKNCNPDNLITLCRKCHNKTNFNRECWIIYFKLL